jgi:hypothetical protein
MRTEFADFTLAEIAATCTATATRIEEDLVKL